MENLTTPVQTQKSHFIVYTNRAMNRVDYHDTHAIADTTTSNETNKKKLFVRLSAALVVAVSLVQIIQVL